VGPEKLRRTALITAMTRAQMLPRISGLMLVLAPALANAQPSNKPAAEILFQRGRELLSEKRVAEACAKFEASSEIDAGIGTLLYLGDCYEQIGRVASAWATFKEAASLAQARSDERERIATIRASALEPRLTRLLVRVRYADRPEGLTIRVDGAPIPQGSWGVALPVDPGWKRVEVAAPGYEPWSRRVSLAGSSPIALDVPRLRPRGGSAPLALAPASGSVTPKADQPSGATPGAAQRTVALVIGGLGVAALATGTVLAVQAQRKNDASLDHCPNDPALCSSRGKELRDEALDYAHASTAVFAAGGALVLAAVVVHIASPSPSRVASQRVAVNFGLDRTGGALRLSGGF
jgi:serine/threonine-protein kinase